jgi:beta-glucanase (GH16 family)
VRDVVWRASLIGMAVGAAAAPSQARSADASTATRWVLVWSDEFDGPAGHKPDARFWRHNVGNRESHGWGNQELAYYTDSPRNVSLDGKGLLLIQALRDRSGGPCWNAPTCEFTSGRLLTEGRVEFTYGKVEARIQVPAGRGIWPAFWALAPGPWPQAGEIDIMEFVGKEPLSVFGTVHGPGYSGAHGFGKGHSLERALSDDFHVFSIIKRPHEIEWFVDGRSFHRVTPALLPAGRPWVFERPYFLILNLAVGGHWPGAPDASTPFPATMRVDYVRVFREELPEGRVGQPSP